MNFMGYNLFIDDQIDDYSEELGDFIRNPKRIDPSRFYDVQVKTSQEAIDYMKKHGCPEFISFDHDLGEDEDGKPMTSRPVQIWMVEMDLDNPNFIPDSFSYQIHSKNNQALNNLSYLNDYLNKRK